MIPLWINDYTGLTFREFGRDRDGLDCWGLLRLVYAEQFGLDLPSYLDEYENTKDTGLGDVFPREAEKDWIEIPAGRERLGDAVLIRMRRVPMHVGMVIGEGRMIHICEGIDSTAPRYNAAEWRSRIIGFYRHRELART